MRPFCKLPVKEGTLHDPPDTPNPHCCVGAELSTPATLGSGRSPAMGDPGQAVRDPHFWVRFTEMVFAIIAFSVIAEGAGYSR